MNRGAVWTNAILFQLAWVCAVGGAARGWWWMGPLSTAVFAMFVLRHGGQVRNDICLAFVAAACGLAIDSLWVHFGLLSYASPVPGLHGTPLWIVTLWINFALSLNHSLAWLLRRPLFAGLLGAIGGPLSYFFAAHTWHAVMLTEPISTTLIALAVAWAIVTPLLCLLAVRLSASRADTRGIKLLRAMST